MGILDKLKSKMAQKAESQDDREEELLEKTRKAIIKEQHQHAGQPQPQPSSQVPMNKRQLRKHNKARDSAIYKSLKPIYDEIYAQESVKVIKERAKRDARQKYGRTKSQKRRDAIKSLTAGLNEMGDLLGGTQPQRQRQPQRRKGQGRKGQARKRKDPFDFDMDFDFKL